jgi:DNA-binding CsgD family transcriptional regulator/PAS domain-containing protein
MPDRSLNRHTTFLWLWLLAASAKADPSDEQFQALARTCPFPVGIIDLTHRCLAAATPRLLAMLGVEEEDPRSLDLHVLVGEEQSLDALLDLIAHECIDTYVAHRHLRRPHAEPIEADSWVTGWYLRDRGLALWLVAPSGEGDVVDVGDVELSLEAWPTHLVGIAIGTFDASWRIDRVSVDIESVLGLPAEKVMGARFLDLVDERDQPRFLAAVGQVVADQAGVSTELRLATDDSGQRPVQVLIVPLAEPRLQFGFAIGPHHEDDGDRSDAGTRIATLERHLWRIAREVEDAGVVHGFARVPDAGAVPGLEGLSRRQWEVLTRLLRGERPPGIAKALFVSQSTVRNHLTAIFRKLGVNSQEELLELLHGSADARPGI